MTIKMFRNTLYKVVFSIDPLWELLQVLEISSTGRATDEPEELWPEKQITSQAPSGSSLSPAYVFLYVSWETISTDMRPRLWTSPTRIYRH